MNGETADFDGKRRVGFAAWIAIGVAALALYAGFLYRPAIFGYYGFSYEQCLLIYSPHTPSSEGTKDVVYACRELFTES